VLHHLKVRQIQLFEVADVHVGGHHVAGRADPLSQPDRHRPAARTDLETTPAGLNHVPAPSRSRVEDLLEERQPSVLGNLATSSSEAIPDILLLRLRAGVLISSNHVPSGSRHHEARFRTLDAVIVRAAVCCHGGFKAARDRSQPDRVSSRLARKGETTTTTAMVTYA